MKRLSTKSLLILLLSPVIYFIADILDCVFATVILFIIRLVLYQILPMATTMYVTSHRLYNLVHFYMPVVRLSYAIITTIFIVEIVKYFNKNHLNHKHYEEQLSDAKRQIIFKESDNNI